MTFPSWSGSWAPLSASGIKMVSALFLLLTLLLFCLALDRYAREQQAASEQQIAGQSANLAVQLDAALRETDLALDTLGASPDIAQLLGGAPLNLTQRVQLQQQLYATILRIPLLGQIQIVDRDCKVVFSSRGDTGVSLQPSKLCLWMHERKQREDGHYTASNSLPGNDSVQQAIKLHDGQQQVIGMAIGILPQQEFFNAAQTLASAPDDEILLQDMNANLLARWPARSGRLQPVSLDSLTQHPLYADENQQIFRARSPLDQVERLYSIRVLENYPLSVAVGQSSATNAAAWRDQATTYLLAWLVLAAVTWRCASLQLRALEHQRQQQLTALQLRQQQEQTHQILQALPEAILLVDQQDLRIRYANSQAQALLQLDDTTAPLPDIDGARPNSHFGVQPLARMLNLGQRVHDSELEIVGNDQSALWVMASIEPLHGQDSLSSLVTLRDLSADKQLRQALSEQSQHIEVMSQNDPLTALQNGRTAQLILRGEIERCQRYGQPLSVACFDIDHFTAFNQQYGRQSGDNVLIAVAAILKQGTRSTDICARTDGQAFMVIFTNTPLVYACKVMERIRHKIAATIFPFAHDRITFSGGVTSWRLDDDTQSLLGRAQELIHQAKQAGRNTLLSDQDA